MTTVFLNGRFFSQPITGVQRFARELTARLVSLVDGLVVVLPRNARCDLDLPTVRVGSSTGHVWEQTDLRRFLRKMGNPTLVGLANTGPVRYRNQIIVHHDVTYIRQPTTFSRRFAWAYRVLASQTLPFAKAVVTVSDFSRAEIASVYPLTQEAIYVVRNGVSAAFLGRDSLALSAGAPFVAVGSLLPHKNLNTLIEAYMIYSSVVDRPASLAFVGSKPEIARSLDLVVGPNCGEIKFLGRVADEELADLYARSRALVFPSLYEGFGIPPIEAQAAGCPVLASAIPPLVENLGDSALFFDPRSARSIADAMIHLDADMSLRDTLVSRGRVNAQRFSWDVEAERLARIITSKSSLGPTSW